MRRSLPFLLLGLTVLGTSTDCAQTPISVPVRSLERSGKLALLCLDPGLTVKKPGYSLENCSLHGATKEGGTGLGLFMSYGIVREHQGQLLFEGNRRGAVFTVILSPFGG